MIDIGQIEREVELGYVDFQDHPTLPLRIYNYTDQAVFERRWNDATSVCRGLVVERGTGRIVARPFSKFFNLEEHLSRGETMPLLPWEATDKMDGSLGIAFWYDDRWHMATRGSFFSEQAVVGRAMMDSLRMMVVPTEFTLLFEIIYPENRIVVNYNGESKLVLIGCMTDVADFHHFALSALAESMHCQVTPLLARGVGVLDVLPDRPNAEGYVIRYSNGFRVKIKHEEYVRLHAIVTRISSYSVWEMLRDRRPLKDILYAVPDEFHAWVSNMERRIRRDLAKAKARAAIEIKECQRDTRKETALAWKARGCRIPSGIFFGILDGKDVRDLLFDTIKPPYERPA